MREPFLDIEDILFLIRAFLVRSTEVPVEVRLCDSGYVLKGPGVLALGTAVSVAVGPEGIAALKN